MGTSRREESITMGQVTKVDLTEAIMVDPKEESHNNKMEREGSSKGMCST